MALRSESIGLALCAILIGSASAWALAPHDRAGGPRQQQFVNQHAEPAQNESIARPDERSTADRPLIVKTVSRNKTPQETEQDRRDRKDKRWYDRAGLIIGVVTGCGVILQTIVFGFQAYIFRKQANSLQETIVTMRRLGRRQSKDMQVSIDVAQAAAQAAIDQVALSRIALTSTERAFIVPDPFISYPMFGDDEETVIGWQFRVVWRNVGNTPTRGFRNNSGLLIRKFNDLPFLNYSSIELPEINKGYIGPDKTSALQKHDVVVDAVIDARAEEIDLYLWAWADYDDVFDGTSRHRTEVCVKIVVVGHPGTKECGFRYQLIGEFNGLDGECQHRPLPYRS